MDLRDGVTFHDGTKFDAAAVVANIERSKTLKESRRKSELASVDKVEAVGDLQVKFTLKHPDSTLLAQLADRAGMMMSPKALKEEGLDFGNNPVCSGPFKFVERVQQDRIVLEKYDKYWNVGKIFIDKVTYLPIPDTTVRLANLRSGDIDMLERLAPTDAESVKNDSNLTFASAVSLGYQGITTNVGNGKRADNPFGKDKRLRQAFSLAIDRNALNQVVFNGAYAPGNQPFPPNSPWYDKDFPVPERDVEKAKALMKEAGFDRFEVNMQVANNPQQMQLVQVIQSMVAEAGFDVKIKATEFATLLAEQTAGNYQASQVGWSGRIDPDGNLHQFVT
jgi:peptide/nickel transport system substrate-binding protein